jgi:hypothetical protein
VTLEVVLDPNASWMVLESVTALNPFNEAMEAKLVELKALLKVTVTSPVAFLVMLATPKLAAKV